MPRKPIDYSKTHFYKIVCKDTSITDCYVGHTTDFTKRKWYHKSTSSNMNNRNYEQRVYRFIRDNGGWENWEMILINTECCENALQARQRERFYKEQLNSLLNSQVPSRTLKEYCETHREKRNAYMKAYNPIYREKNAEQLKQKKKQYRQENENRIKEKRKEKITCECGSIFCRGKYSRHIRTQKHQDYIQTIVD